MKGIEFEFLVCEGPADEEGEQFREPGAAGLDVDPAEGRVGAVVVFVAGGVGGAGEDGGC